MKKQTNEHNPQQSNQQTDSKRKKPKPAGFSKAGTENKDDKLPGRLCL